MQCKGSHEIAQSNPRNQALKAKQMLNSRSEIGWACDPLHFMMTP